MCERGENCKGFYYTKILLIIGEHRELWTIIQLVF